MQEDAQEIAMDIECPLCKSRGVHIVFWESAIDADCTCKDCGHKWGEYVARESSRGLEFLVDCYCKRESSEE